MLYKPIKNFKVRLTERMKSKAKKKPKQKSVRSPQPKRTSIMRRFFQDKPSLEVLSARRVFQKSSRTRNYVTFRSAGDAESKNNSLALIKKVMKKDPSPNKSPEFNKRVMKIVERVLHDLPINSLSYMEECCNSAIPAQEEYHQKLNNKTFSDFK